MTSAPEFYLRPPSGDRKSYRLIKRTRGPEGSANETVPNEVLEAVSRQLQRGDLTPAEAKEAAQRELLRVRRREARPKTQTLRPANLRLLDKYWDDVYASRDLVDARASRDRLRRALEALGDVPLTAARQDLQNAINRAAQGRPAKQRDIVAALTQILHWMGRTDVRLTKAKQPLTRVRYLTLPDFEKVVPHIDKALQPVAWLGFATGCRLGEVFALERRNWRAAKGTVWVDSQIRDDLQPGPPKNRRPREAPVLDGGRAWLERWLEVPMAERLPLRGRRFSSVVRAACRKAFPGDSSRHVVFHDLRHSYAIHLLSASIPTDLVAKALGDSVAVTERFYTGFILVDEGVATMQRLLKAQSS